MTPDLHQIGVFLLIALFFALYSVLDGFDLGIGMMLPFTRTQRDAARLVSHISPFWDGNEVWLVTGAGFIFGAFPSVLGVLLGTIYLPFLLLIAGLILRAMALEYSYHDLARQRFWHLTAACGSFLVATLGLFVLGSILQGLPFDGPGQLSRNPGDYLAAFPILFTLSGLVVVIWHGATYALKQDASEGRENAMKGLWAALAGAIAVLAGAWTCILPGTLGHPLALLGGFLCVSGALGGRVLLARAGWAFRCSCVTITGLWILIAASLYPAILPCRQHPEWSLTLTSAAAPASTVRVLFLTGLILTPIIITYSLLIYRILRISKPGENSNAANGNL